MPIIFFKSQDGLIGMESNGLIVVLDNMSGEVYLEDYEVEKFIPLKCTLEEMIQHLSFHN